MQHWNEIDLENVKYKIRNRPFYLEITLLCISSQKFSNCLVDQLLNKMANLLYSIKKAWRKTIDLRISVENSVGKVGYLNLFILELSFEVKFFTVKMLD